MKRILRKQKRRKIFNMEKGTVKWFSCRGWRSRGRGYGFITNDETGIETFVHWTDICMEGYKRLEEGQKVSYEVKEMEDGKTKAVNVTVLEKTEVVA